GAADHPTSRTLDGAGEQLAPAAGGNRAGDLGAATGCRVVLTDTAMLALGPLDGVLRRRLGLLDGATVCARDRPSVVRLCDARLIVRLGEVLADALRNASLTSK